MAGYLYGRGGQQTNTSKAQNTRADFVCFECVELHKDCELCKAGGEPFNNNTAI